MESDENLTKRHVIEGKMLLITAHYTSLGTMVYQAVSMIDKKLLHVVVEAKRE